MTTGGNPHYVPYYEDYEPYSPLPALITGREYERWQSTPIPGAHALGQLGHAAQVAWSYAVRPAFVGATALGHTYYLTAEQWEQDKRQKEQLALQKKQAADQESMTNLMRLRSKLVPPLLEESRPVSPKPRRRKSVPGKPSRHVPTPDVPERGRPAGRRDNVGEPEPFEPPLTVPQSVTIEDIDVELGEPLELPRGKPTHMRAFDVTVPKDYILPRVLDPVAEARRQDFGATAASAFREGGAEYARAFMNSIPNVPPEILTMLTPEGLQSTLTAQQVRVPKILADVTMGPRQVSMMYPQRLINPKPSKRSRKKK